MSFVFPIRIGRIGTKATPPVPLVPLQHDPATRFLPSVMVVLSFLACLSLAATLLLSHLSARWQGQLSGGMTIALPSLSSKTETDQKIATKADLLNQQAVIKRLKETAGILNITQVPEADLRAMMQPLLSDSPKDRQSSTETLVDIALPVMFDVRLDPAVPIDAHKLQKRLADIHPGIVIAPHQEMADTLTAPARLARWVSLGVIIAALLLCGLVIALVVQAGIRTHEPLLQMLSLMGASDQTLSHDFRSHIIRQTLPGALVGLGLAILALRGAYGMLRPSEDQLVHHIGHLLPGLYAGDWAMMGMMPLLLTGLAIMVTGRIVQKSLTGPTSERQD